MSNYITIEFCAEDRARIDRLTAALENRVKQVDEFLAGGNQLDDIQKADPEQLTIDDTHAEHPVEPAEATEVEAPATPQPAVTLEQIQQKVVQLAAGQGGAKKAKVREIINAYGSKVSDLNDQPDKWTEVWDKLTALEGEG